MFNNFPMNMNMGNMNNMGMMNMNVNMNNNSQFGFQPSRNQQSTHSLFNEQVSSFKSIKN